MSRTGRTVKQIASQGWTYLRTEEGIVVAEHSNNKGMCRFELYYDTHRARVATYSTHGGGWHRWSRYTVPDPSRVRSTPHIDSDTWVTDVLPNV